MSIARAMLTCLGLAVLGLAGCERLWGPYLQEVGGDGGGPPPGGPDLSSPHDWFTGMPATTLGGSFSQPADVCFSGDLLYVSDFAANRVLVYQRQDLSDPAKVAAANPTFNIGMVMVATHLPLAGPHGLWCGCEEAGCTTHSLLVADTLNHRVTYYQGYGDNPTNNPLPDGVIGQPGFSKNAANRGMGATVPDGLRNPSGVFWDTTSTDAPSRRVYIADTGNNRVVGYPAATGDAVKALSTGAPDLAFGQGNLSTGTAQASPTADDLSGPQAVSVFAARVAIADANFQRVTVYGVPAPMPTLPLHADGVLGQRGLDQAVNTPALSSLYNPAAVMTDGHQTFVADKSNNRVLVYNQFFAAVGMYGPAAFAALGQPLPDRIKTPPDIGPADLNQPAGVALAVIGGKTVLFVADQGNHRVQVFYRPQ